MTRSEIVNVVNFLYPNNAILFRNEKVLQIETKFASSIDSIPEELDKIQVALDQIGISIAVIKLETEL